MANPVKSNHGMEITFKNCDIASINHFPKGFQGNLTFSTVVDDSGVTSTVTTNANLTTASSIQEVSGRTLGTLILKEQTVSSIDHIGNVFLMGKKVLQGTKVMGSVNVTGDINAKWAELFGEMTITGKAELTKTMCHKKITINGELRGRNLCVFGGISATGKIYLKDCNIDAISDCSQVILSNVNVNGNVSSKGGAVIEGCTIKGTLTCVTNYLTLLNSKVEEVHLMSQPRSYGFSSIGNTITPTGDKQTLELKNSPVPRVIFVSKHNEVKIC